MNHKRLTVAFRLGPDGTHLQASGRNSWALLALIRAGEQGVTPIAVPGPRWSAYVHNLRGMGVNIDTIHENHAGQFPGNHARYVLKSQIVISQGGQSGETV